MSPCVASILHDFYTGVEKVFISLARELDGYVPHAEGWHRLLLEQMSLSLPDKRPALINHELAGDLQEYLAFRHRFRNLYGFELEWSRMRELVVGLPDVLERFEMAIHMLLESLHP